MQITYKTDSGYVTSRNIRNKDEAEEVEKFLRDAGKKIEVKTEV